MNRRFWIENRAIQNRAIWVVRFQGRGYTLVGCASDWRVWVDFLRFYFTAIPLILVLLTAEILSIPGLRFWKSSNSRFYATKLWNTMSPKIIAMLTRERCQKFQVMKFWNFGILGSEECGGFLVANYLSPFHWKNRLNICHRKLHHILHCKKRNLSPGTHSGSILA